MHIKILNVFFLSQKFQFCTFFLQKIKNKKQIVQQLLSIVKMINSNNLIDSKPIWNNFFSRNT